MSADTVPTARAEAETSTRAARTARVTGAAATRTDTPGTPTGTQRAPTTRVTGATAAAEAGLVLALCLLPVVLYRDFFTGGAALLRLAAAAVSGWLLGIVALRRRWTASATVLWSVPVGLLITLYAAFPKAARSALPAAGTLRSLATGLRAGWAHMLTVTLPADPTGVLLATPVAATFGTTLLAVVIAGRRRAALGPVGPPLLAFVAALLLTAPVAAPRLLPAAALAAAGLVLALLRANRVTSTSRGHDDAPARPALGRVAFGVPMVAAAIAFGVAAASVPAIADGRDRFDPRDLRQPPMDVRSALSPLVVVRNQLEADPQRPLFTIAFDGPPPTDRVRVATLNRFDGALWTGPPEHRVAGHVLPRAEDVSPDAPLVTAEIAVTRLDGPFLPVPGRPLEVTADDVAFNAEAGTLVTSQPLRDYRYTVVGALPLQPSDVPAGAEPGGVPPAVTAPQVPRQLRAVADAVFTPAGPQPLARLRALEAHLREQFPYGLSRPPGHSYGTLAQMLLGDDEQAVGYAEQHAAAFAVLANAAGYPARVAVGYLLDDAPDGSEALLVTTADAHAWPEVHFPGYGWVPFEPTDLEQRARFVPDPDDDLIEADTVQQARPPQVVRPNPATTADRRHPAAGWPARLVAAATAGAIGLAVLLLLLPVAVLLTKATRRWLRSSRGDAAQRTLGAWHETVDRLREAGIRVTTAQTADEMADLARARWGGPATATVAELAALAGMTVFAPWEPDAGTARRAWRLEVAARRSLRGTRSRPARVRAALDPRPLLPLPPPSRPSLPPDPTPPPAAPDGEAAAEPVLAPR